MLHFVLLVVTLFVPSQSWLVDNVIDYFFNSFDGDKFQNVGVGQTIECGKNDKGEIRDCIILCDKTNSCANSTFIVGYGNIQIICQKPYSCANVFIKANYAQSINMSFMASNSFLNGQYMGVGSERVITQCSFGISCKGSTFYYNEDEEVIHNCSSWNGAEWSSHGACRESNIVALGGKVTLDFSNSQAFYPGNYYGYQNEEVTTYCRSDSACSSAVFHYDSFKPVKHYCVGGTSCSSAIIHALTRTDVDCHGVKGGSSTYSCYSTALISPTNNYTVTVHGDDYAPSVSNRMALYLTSTDNIKDLVICEDDCSNDRIVFYAANDYRYERNCSFENADYCLDELANRLDSNPFTVYENYYWDAKGLIDEQWTEGPILTLYAQFPTKLWDENTWRTTPKFDTQTLTAPKGLGDNEYMVLCIDCKKVDFDLSNAENAIIYGTNVWQAHATWISYNSIETSSNEFTYIGTTESQNITINAEGSSQVNIRNIGRFGEVYLGDVMDVNINCTQSLACIGVNVHTDINPMDEEPLAPHSEFQIQCQKNTYGDSPCAWYNGGYPTNKLVYGLYVDFSYLNKKCRIGTTGPDTDECPFLSYASVRSNAQSSDVDSYSVPGYVIGLVVGGAVVLLVVAVMLYSLRKNKKMQSAELYANLNDATV
eukprot:504201_1